MKKFAKIISLLLIIATLTTLLCACRKENIERGTTEEDTYTNESLGLTFTKPSNWVFLTEEQLAQLMNITLEQFQDEKLIASAKVTTVIDFMAQHPTSGSNVNLTFENLKPSKNTKMTAEEYLEITKENLEKQLPGAKYTFSEEKTVELGGEEYLMVEAQCSYTYVSMTQYFYLRKVGDYMVSICATTTQGEKAEVFEAMFS